MSDLKKLNENEIYTMLLYAMYKFTNDENYSTISELMYTLDKTNFFKLCSVFGGCTIKVPTINEIKIYVKALLVYECVQEGKSFEEALSEAEVDFTEKTKIIQLYKSISEVVDEYFKTNAS